LQLLGEESVQRIVEMIQARQNNQVLSAEARFIQPTLIVRESTQMV